jgi:hypothetical protein
MGGGYIDHIFLASALAGDEWSASRPNRFTLGERVPGLIELEAWRTPKPVWTTWRGEEPCLYRDPKSDPSAVQLVVSRYIDCSIPAPRTKILTYLSLHIKR